MRERIATISTFIARYRLHALLFALYYVVGRVGLSVQPVNTFATFVWPATAIALCALLLGGYRLWPAITLAAFAVNYSVGGDFFAAVGIATGNTLEALAGAYFLNHYIGLNNALVRLRDTLGLVVTAYGAPIISATIGVASIVASGAIPLQNAWTSWVAWWSGDALSILILAPLLLKWLPKPLFHRTRAQYAELIVANCAVLLVAVAVFFIPQAQFVYALFIPLIWVALRTGPRGISLAIFLASSTAIIMTLLGMGPYAQFGLFPLGVFVVTISTLFLIFTSIVEERKNAIQELGHHVEELEQALHKISSEDEAKKKFLAILAHELRNPLAAILSSTEVLRISNNSPAESSQLLQTIYKHVHSMRTMLDDVLDISRISHNKLTLKKSSVAIDTIIDQSVRSVGPLIRDRRHQLVITRPEQALFIDGDTTRIEQMLVNLLNNAAKYTNQQGRIELSAREEGGMAVIVVRDNGIGIPKSMQKRIFEPFFQVRRGKLATEGLGVGLPLIRQLAEMHGGTIEARSEGEGKGSEFILKLPLATKSLRMAPHQTIVREKKRVPKTHSIKHTKTILVVDDNEAAAESLAKLLELRGHQVRVAYNGLDAVDKAREQKPDIVVLDIGLPDIDGYEVVRLLKSDASFPSAIIALTGYGQEGDKERALEAGFHLHLTKPVGLKELERAFKKVVRVA